MTGAGGCRVQRVTMPYGGAESWTVVDSVGAAVDPVESFLSYLHAVERSPNTVKAYAHDLRDFFEFLAQLDLSWDAVRLEDAGRFVAWLRLPPSARRAGVSAFLGSEGYCSAGTVNRKLSAIAALFEFHHRHGAGPGLVLSQWRQHGRRGGSWQPLLAHLGARPGHARLIKLREEHKIAGTISREQTGMIIEACGRLRDRFLLSLLAESGLRIGEALGLRHEDIDVAARLVSVVPRANGNAARAKSGPRRVPVPARLIRLYSDYLHVEYGEVDSDFVFVNLWSGQVGAPLAYRSVYDLVVRLRRQTGVSFGPHTFRHSYATELLRRSVPVEIVQRLLGHASIATTGDTYAHLEIEDAQRALVRAGWIDGQDAS